MGRIKNLRKMSAKKKKQDAHIAVVARRVVNKQIETKYTEAYATGTEIPLSNSAFNVDAFVNCAVGTSDNNQRIGDTLKAVGIFLNIAFSPTTNPTSSPAHNKLRLLVVRHFDSGSVGLSNVLQDTTTGYAGIVSPPFHDNKGRLKILYDRIFDIGYYQKYPHLKKYISLHGTTVGFNAGSTGSPIKNGIRVYLFSAQNFATHEVPKINYRFRTIYKDA